MKTKSRNISILEFLERLQLEYLHYELRSKIYPQKESRERYIEVMGFKKDKIINICQKNSLLNMFIDGKTHLEIKSKFFDSNGVPVMMTKRDKYFYYYVGEDFSYKGRGVKLLKYDFDNGTCVLEEGGEKIRAKIKDIKRIL